MSSTLSMLARNLHRILNIRREESLAEITTAVMKNVEEPEMEGSGSMTTKEVEAAEMVDTTMPERLKSYLLEI